jgi:hypothetical protein
VSLLSRKDNLHTKNALKREREADEAFEDDKEAEKTERLGDSDF